VSELIGVVSISGLSSSLFNSFSVLSGTTIVGIVCLSVCFVVALSVCFVVALSVFFCCGFRCN
jgi:sorbitol-specific phosphotransferase system component IIBC